MFSTQELVAQYENYSDDELFDIYSNPNNYSDEAKAAFNIVIANKGGVESLLNRRAEKQRLTDEAQRIRLEAAEFNAAGSDISFAKNMITSELLPSEKVDEIIESVFYIANMEKEDIKIKPRTVYGSIIGGTMSSVIGGILWGGQLIYSKRIFLFILIALALFCYVIIRLFTKQSKKNVAVLIATIISFLIALAIGQIMFEVIGYRGL